MGIMRSTQVRTLLLVHALALFVSYWSAWSWSWGTVLCGEAGLLLLVCLPLCRKMPTSPLDPHFAGVPVPRLHSDLLKVENIAGIQYGGCAAQGGGGEGVVGSSLSSSWCCIPHPAKAHRGGEDAVFVTPWSVGCADGVGGWAARGIDSGLYARGLMHGCERAAMAGQGVLQGEGEAGVPAGRAQLTATLEAFAQGLNPVRLLKEGYDGVQRQHIIGSTTACVASYLPLPSDGRGDSKPVAGGAAGTMQIANLGDSGCMVIRDGRVVLRTVEQTHAFNFPRQLGTGSQDTPADADRLSIPVLEGDIIVLGTDGLFDNMFDDEILQLVVERCRDVSTAFPGPDDPAQAKDFAGVARDLAIAAYGRACDRTRISPFVRRGVEAGCLDGAKVAAGAHCGGKLDDITCVLSRCVLASKPAVTGKARGSDGAGSSGAVSRAAAGGTAKAGATGAAGPSGSA